MKPTVTIACAGTCHNQSGQANLHLQLIQGITCLALGITLAGCATTEPATPLVPVWQLASAERSEPVFVGRSRVSYDRPLPAHLLQELSPEFALVTIRNSGDWMELCRSLHLQPSAKDLDLSRGVVVGLLARIGESVDGRWPLDLQYVRRCGSEGFIEARFNPGLYHPLVTADYLELAYAPDVRHIRMVQINRRRFVINTRAPLH